mmetsp:Transcript_13921/g.36093  ORF Transcript_13921/g.36093 Transcript_13921/m.36093 type:complete len:236 (+) Transcript_13921:291-998(+)
MLVEEFHERTTGPAHHVLARPRRGELVECARKRHCSNLERALLVSAKVEGILALPCLCDVEARLREHPREQERLLECKRVDRHRRWRRAECSLHQLLGCFEHLDLCRICGDEHAARAEHPVYLGECFGLVLGEHEPEDARDNRHGLGRKRVHVLHVELLAADVVDIVRAHTRLGDHVGLKVRAQHVHSGACLGDTECWLSRPRRQVEHGCLVICWECVEHLFHNKRPRSSRLRML